MKYVIDMLLFHFAGVNFFQLSYALVLTLFLQKITSQLVKSNDFGFKWFSPSFCWWNISINVVYIVTKTLSMKDIMTIGHSNHDGFC